MHVAMTYLRVTHVIRAGDTRCLHTVYEGIVFYVRLRAFIRLQNAFTCVTAAYDQWHRCAEEYKDVNAWPSKVISRHARTMRPKVEEDFTIRGK